MTKGSSQFVFSERGHAANVSAWAGVPVRRVVQSQDCAWRRLAMMRMNDLVKLEEGWDGYRGRPVTFANAYFALEALASLCRADTIPPQIVPGPAGDLQIEWHTADVDIELHIRGANDVHAYRSRRGEEEEHLLTNDFEPIANWMADLSEVSSVADAAAA